MIENWEDFRIGDRKTNNGLGGYGFLTALLAAVLLCAAGPAKAQEVQEVLEVQEEGPIPGFSPALTIEAQTDDNVLRVNQARKSDTAVIISPTLKFLFLSGKHGMQAFYDGHYGVHRKNTLEDFNDHRGKAEVNLDLASAYKFNILGEYQLGHEYRGYSGSRLDEKEKPDTFRHGIAGGELLMGGAEDSLRISLSGKEQTRRYSNNGQDARNRNLGDLGLTVFYNIGPKTSIFIIGRQGVVDYLNPLGINLDSAESEVMAGAKWDVTALTSGEIRAGFISKNLKDPGLADYSGFGLDGIIYWTPREFMKVYMILSRRTEETTDVNSSYYVNNRAFVKVDYEMNSRFWLVAAINYEKDFFSKSREDAYTFGSGELKYGLLRQLAAKLVYRRESRISNIPGQNFQANIFALALTAEAL
jgi:hypothetical protein